MKSLPIRIHQSSAAHFRIGLLITIAGLVFLLEGRQVEARDFGGRGRGLAGAAIGYRYANNQNGYWYGYGYGPTVGSTGSNASSRAAASTNYLTTLPAGAAPVVVFGKTYYFADGNYYSPEFRGGATVYVVANP